MKRILTLILAAAALFSCLMLNGCAKADPYEEKTAGFQLEKPAKGDEIAVMKTTLGDIYIRFFPEGAPKAVENFISLAKKGYYNDRLFFRVDKDFCAQSGDPKNDGTGGASIWETPFEDEFSNKLFNLKGSLAMANSDVNTNGSQFFFNLAPADLLAKWINAAKSEYERIEDVTNLTNWKQLLNGVVASDAEKIPDDVLDLYAKTGGSPDLDGAWRATGGHTVFGQVYDGLAVLDKINEVKVKGEKPVTDVKIISITFKAYAG